ncbi:MAG: helix-turn-helix transcriptional regulator [Symploca sp. SIO2E9]|nr:helix-turn-helix transcriptional regulator [Symploca sp. SIO2E9]
MPKKQSSQQPQENVSPLRKLREQANLTQEQLSVRLDVSTSTLRRWENGNIEPAMTHEQWIIFCEEVGVPFEELPNKLNLRAK